MVNNAAALPPYEGPITSNPDDGKPFSVTIPFLGVAGPATNPASDGAPAACAPNGSSVTTVSAQIANPSFTQFRVVLLGRPAHARQRARSQTSPRRA